MKIAIVDTQGPNFIGEKYRALLPGVRISGFEPRSVRGTPCHEHGALCGWLAAAPVVAAGRDLELVFVRCFDEAAGWIKDADSWILDRLEEIRPDYVSRSWGAWDGDDPLQRQMAYLSFAQFAKDYAPMIEAGGIADFGASGNEDRNDADDDVAFPQAVLPRCNVIGAHYRGGRPCEWSGDGTGVLCCMWAERIWSPNAAGKWVLWSGTSGATPKACGAAAARGILTEGWRLLTIDNARRPRGYSGADLPHRKWGHGSMEWAWQEPMQKLPAALRPPAPAAPKARPALHDYLTMRRAA